MSVPRQHHAAAGPPATAQAGDGPEMPLAAVQSQPHPAPPAQTSVPLDRLRAATGRWWALLAAVVLVTAALVLAVHEEPPVRGWVFAVPCAVAIALVAGVLWQRCWKWLTTARPLSAGQATETDVATLKAFAGALSVLALMFGYLQTLDGTPDPFKVTAMFSAPLCSGTRATVDAADAGSMGPDGILRIPVTVTVTAPPGDGEEYLIMTHSLNSTPQAYFVKKILDDQQAQRGAQTTIELQLNTAGKTGFRYVFIACAEIGQADTWISQNMANDPNPAWNVNRRALPEGVFQVSACLPEPEPTIAAEKVSSAMSC